MTWRDWLTKGLAWCGFPPTPQSLGQRGEVEAARFLQRLGYQIVARGERARLGEIDLVAVDGRTVVFVEVKTRASDHAGAPAEAVDEAKQRRITRTALLYMKRHDLLEVSSRFDIISITWPDRGRPQIDHLRGAFEPTGTDGFFS
jgi:putative endonuclease